MPRVNEQEAIQRIMNGLKCSEAEAKQVFEYDRAIDHGEKTPYDLTPQQEKEARKATRADRRKNTVYDWSKPRARKPNATKGMIIAAVAEWLRSTEEFSADNIEVTNAERQIKFTSAGETFELTLVQKRKPKT